MRRPEGVKVLTRADELDSPGERRRAGEGGERKENKGGIHEMQPSTSPSPSVHLHARYTVGLLVCSKRRTPAESAVSRRTGWECPDL